MNSRWDKVSHGGVTNGHKGVIDGKDLSRSSTNLALSESLRRYSSNFQLFIIRKVLTAVMMKEGRGRQEPHPESAVAQARPRRAKKGATKMFRLATILTINQDDEKLAVARPVQLSKVPMTTVARTLPLLVCSIGNPGSSYANTLHSAGLTVTQRLAEHIGYPPFSRDRKHGDGLISKPSASGASGDWTLWQSTSYMNESGKGVRAAFQAWTKNLGDGQGKLVIIHDELEKPVGTITVRTDPGASAKGHNGIKSVQSAMGKTPFARIGIGIGRPVSRDSDEVARYVLKKMTSTEKQKIEGCVEEVVAKLRQLEKV